MCIHPDPVLEAAKLRKRLTLASYRPDSYRAIGKALGVSQTQARNDAVAGVNQFTPEPDHITGTDGKSYPERPVERLTARCEACPADCRCCDIVQRIEPGEEHREDGLR